MQEDTISISIAVVRCPRGHDSHAQILKDTLLGLHSVRCTACEEVFEVMMPQRLPFPMIRAPRSGTVAQF
jgi:hypothetical protein